MFSIAVVFVVLSSLEDKSQNSDIFCIGEKFVMWDIYNLYL